MKTLRPSETAETKSGKKKMYGAGEEVVRRVRENLSGCGTRTVGRGG